MPMAWAPSRAKASAMAWPMPRLAPVTTTTLLENRFMSAQVSRFDAVHVVEGLVFAGHAPDKTVVPRTATGVDGPRGRQHHLLVLHKQMPRLGRFAHQVDEDFVPEVKVQINFGAPVVG